MPVQNPVVHSRGGAQSLALGSPSMFFDLSAVPSPFLVGMRRLGTVPCRWGTCQSLLDFSRVRRVAKAVKQGAVLWILIRLRAAEVTVHLRRSAARILLHQQRAGGQWSIELPWHAWARGRFEWLRSCKTSARFRMSWQKGPKLISGVVVLSFASVVQAAWFRPLRCASIRVIAAALIEQPRHVAQLRLSRAGRADPLSMASRKRKREHGDDAAVGGLRDAVKAVWKVPGWAGRWVGGGR